MAFLPFSLNIKGHLVEIDRPQIMGIVNVTPDSFFSGSRATDTDSVRRRVETLISDGADIIDIGAYSSRPGADDVSPDEELRRIEIGLKAIRDITPDILVSVDTFRASVANKAVNSLGADIVNDISGGDLDPDMFSTIAALHCPYILMHMRGTPATMQTMTDYSDVTADVVRELSFKLERLEGLGVSDIIIDPGFGFSKTLKQNYELMRNIDYIQTVFNLPLLVGISRKSMITRALHITPDEALNATTVLNTFALLRGAAILRVHDVRQAREALVITGLLTNP